MTRIISSATIARPRPIGDVFDYVTTPGHWPDWHPSSLGVSGATDHSLALGEQVTERYRVAGNEGTVVWTVTAREEPLRWTISGEIAGRGFGGTVSYELSSDEAGNTHFARVFEYPTPGPAALAPVVERQIQSESDEAVRRLKDSSNRANRDAPTRTGWRILTPREPTGPRFGPANGREST